MVCGRLIYVKKSTIALFWFQIALRSTGFAFLVIGLPFFSKR